MRSLRRAAVAGAVAAMAVAAPVRAQSTFEGVIQYRFGHDSLILTQTSKGNMVRTDAGMGAMGKVAMIEDTKTHMMTTIMYERKMYMVRPVPSLDSVLETGKHDVTITKTGETQTVAGVSCDVYKGSGTNDQGKVEEGQACLAKGVGFVFFSMMGRSRSAPQGSLAALFQELAAKDLRALKVWSMKDGKMQVDIEAISIEKKSVPNSTFEVPADFMKMDMPMGMGMPKP